MKNRLNHNLFSWLFYSIMIYVLLLPLQLWVVNISVSIILGFFAGMLNDILTQLRKLNGEKFPNLEDNEDKTELIKG